MNSEAEYLLWSWSYIFRQIIFFKSIVELHVLLTVECLDWICLEQLPIASWTDDVFLSFRGEDPLRVSYSIYTTNWNGNHLMSSMMTKNPKEGSPFLKSS